MDDKLIEWLLSEDNPSVRYFTMTRLLKLPDKEPAVASARMEIMRSGIVPLILDRQNQDGSWGDPERFYTDKYKGTAWNLLILAELGADIGDPRVARSCGFILDRSQEPESGAFSHETSVRTKAGLKSGIIPCLTGNMTFALIRLGMLEDPRVMKAVDWIAEYQRADDSEETRPSGHYYDRYSMCWGKHSCHMGVAKALKALAEIPWDRKSNGVKKKSAELVEYFLKHRIFKKSHDLSTVAKPGWTRFGFPLMYQTDALELLEIITRLGVQDGRLSEAVELVRSKQRPNGKWRLESAFNGKLLIDIEGKGMDSKWITLNAMTALNQVEGLH